mmetsp:Transcript_46836/g.73301  ORF Transcript_46836/g.73301 Transcript_46836/m.73301 type:complete len:155 (+) Transcript_46836:1090-1554(+)
MDPPVLPVLMHSISYQSEIITNMCGRWDCAMSQYVFEDKGERVLYRALLDPENNPSPYLNDALFGKFDGESDEYEVEDECINLFTMIPCLSWSQTQKGKVEFSSVWYYPRNGFPWDKEREVTVGYHWPLEPWMKLADLSLSSNEKAVPERESDQ